MNAPFNGDFRVTQEFKGPTIHDGLDLVGITEKNVRCVKSGKVIRTGWENPNNKKQGFGLYVKVEESNGDIWFYGHLSEIKVKLGEMVNIGTILGIEGSTGCSTGSHLHICVRPKGIKANAKNVSDILGIPNKLGIYNDGFVDSKKVNKSSDKPIAETFDKSISGVYKTTARLNFRKSPNGEIIRVLPTNTTVRCYGYRTDGWYLVTCSGETGFVSKDYIKKG